MLLGTNAFFYNSHNSTTITTSFTFIVVGSPREQGQIPSHPAAYQETRGKRMYSFPSCFFHITQNLHLMQTHLHIVQIALPHHLRIVFRSSPKSRSPALVSTARVLHAPLLYYTLYRSSALWETVLINPAILPSLLYLSFSKWSFRSKQRVLHFGSLSATTFVKRDT